ncbi:3-isopropylmalate dehydrogenase [Clostridiaceae bacterium UIB06]|uniref:3-isopropylmalate dehydrogenase n=1 Tax=Clostridium thailandense TaxID=2794346 RepID=A0A949WS70_9CLOT|nr:3-isopropylmalate dehydrogenase [Clostridium thailandense]MBV7274835.1 3-isopropylmalate dehydrogenase [Clostridium thailandense]MCH5137995.1 3-isopropylmalate dehydrogenase [Clostridiaceae bacterium UIB06]
MKITIIPGDGIGREVVKQAVKVLDRIADKYKCNFEFEEALLGGAAIDATGNPIPEETIHKCKSSDAVILGAVGGPKWDNQPGHLRPEKGLLALRKELGVFANLRPAILFPQLKSASTLKDEVLGDGLDIMIVRELIGGAYFGEKKRINIEDGQRAYDTIDYCTNDIKRIAKKSFEVARKRGKKITLVDKANVLETSRLWREIVTNMSEDYKDVEVNYMYVDNAAMQLIRNPKQFDVILTENMFGDILSDEASMLTGSLGMLPSASVGEGNIGLYEPIHGSAPDIAGQDKANPIGTIMSTAMMLRYSFDMEDAAKDIENAVSKVMDKGYRTGDIMENGMEIVGTEEMGALIAAEI